MTNPYQQDDQYAGAAYGVNPDLLSSIGRRESGNRAVAVNGWDSNARAGTPSKGRMQFIQPTFDAYARHAREANPGAWKGVKVDWLNPRAQTLAASWAIKNGHGKAWSTFGAALNDVGGKLGGARGILPVPASAPTHVAIPNAPTTIGSVPDVQSQRVALAFADDPGFVMAYQRLHPPMSAGAVTAPAVSGAAPAAQINGGAKDPNGVINEARAQIGSTLAQAAKYARKNGQPFDSAWCGDFVRSVFAAKGLKPPPARYVPDLLKWAHANHKFTRTATPGALVMYDWGGDGVPDHVGVATGQSRNGQRGAIEGNTGTPTGRGVAEKYRDPRNIIGYAQV